MRKSLLLVTSFIELGAGLAFVLLPSTVVSWLLGVSSDSGAALVIFRMTGLALLALGIGAFLARDDGRSRAGTGFIVGMSFYNFTVAGLFAYSGIALGVSGTLLWPVVVLHAFMGLWCVACLTR